MVEVVNTDEDYSSFRKADDQECVEEIIRELFRGADELIISLAWCRLLVLVKV